MATSSQSCRCCMKSRSKKMANILETGLSGVNDLTLSSSYFNCTGIQISSMEPFPLNVCTPCVKQLQNFHEFREKCIESDQFYRRQSMVMKQEPIDDTETITESVTVEALEPFCVVKEDDADAPIKTEVKVNEGSEESVSDDSADEDFEMSEASNSKKLKIKKEKTKAGATIKSEQKSFVCTVGDCSQRFYVQRRYEGHVRQHKGLKPAVCSFCSKEFSKWIALDQHIDAEHSNRTPDVKCDFPGCTKAFTTLEYKKRHYKAVHRPRKKQTHGTDAQAYICHECGKTFFAITYLKEHLFTHMSNSERPHKCPRCGKGFIQKHKLENHIKAHDGIKNYICPQCGVGKVTQKDLNKHMKCHMGNPYKCDRCEKAFNKKEGLKRHTRVVHEGVRAFHCTYCDLSFGKAETLKHHTMTHTGERPHKCNICDRAFIQPTAYKAHMATHMR